MAALADYTAVVRAYLKGAADMERAADCWQRQIDDLTERLGRASNDMQRARIAAELEERRADIASTRRLLDTLGDMLARLRESDAQLLREHYMQGATWYEIADKYGIAYASARRRGSRAVKALGRMWAERAANANSMIA